jgi:glycerophosphoryl diester phosphodiesterase
LYQCVCTNVNEFIAEEPTSDQLKEYSRMLRLLFQGCVMISLVTWSPNAKAWSTEPVPIVIAHRGASGYLPEHTEGAKILAIAQGADYIEQDVVMSRDGVCIVSHDITMQETTNVAEIFPTRHRPDGKYYFLDFDWDEISQLNVNERTRGGRVEVFPHRFPGGFNQRLMRLRDELKMIQGMEKTLNRRIGIYVELKGVKWHQQNKLDLAQNVLNELNEQGYRTANDRCFVQCFEPEGLLQLRDLKCELRLVELIGGKPLPQDSLGLRLKSIAQYANGVGPSIEIIADVREGQAISNGFVEAAHDAGLVVHPYTVRKDALPSCCESIDELHDLLLKKLKVDGFFTDFPDLGRSAVDGK